MWIARVWPTSGAGWKAVYREWDGPHGYWGAEGAGALRARAGGRTGISGRVRRPGASWRVWRPRGGAGSKLHRLSGAGLAVKAQGASWLVSARHIHVGSRETPASLPRSCRNILIFLAAATWAHTCCVVFLLRLGLREVFLPERRIQAVGAEHLEDGRVWRRGLLGLGLLLEGGQPVLGRWLGLGQSPQAITEQ